MASAVPLSWPMVTLTPFKIFAIIAGEIRITSYNVCYTKLLRILANDLSEIFAWSVDFFGLQKGDRFKMIYEEKYVNDSLISYGKILTAYFEHYGDTIYAIPFNQDSLVSFYDAEGNSLKKAFLKAPLNFRITSYNVCYTKLLRKH